MRETSSHSLLLTVITWRMSLDMADIGNNMENPKSTILTCVSLCSFFRSMFSGYEQRYRLTGVQSASYRLVDVSLFYLPSNLDVLYDVNVDIKEHLQYSVLLA